MHLDPTVQVAIVTAASGVLIALLTRPMRRGIKEANEHAREAREQVQNSHKTNLRDDIDRVLDIVQTVHINQAGVMEDLRQLRDDLATERKERLIVAQQVTVLADQIH